MKRVRALNVEPPLLAQYHANHPAEALRSASEATQTWEEFKANREEYKQLLKLLAEAQQGLCIYCEQRIVDESSPVDRDGNVQFVAQDYQVEHIRAKSKKVGCVLEWKNLALACGGGTYRHHGDASRAYRSSDGISCGQKKGNGLATVLLRKNLCC